MAEPRNNIYRHYPRAAKFDLVRWREIDGMPTGDVIAAAAEKYPHLPAIHGSTWAQWHDSDEYVAIRDAITREGERSARLNVMWQAVEEGATDTALQGTLYLLLHRAFELAADEKKSFDPKELKTLITAVYAGRQATRDEEIARMKGEVALLRGQLAAATGEAKSVGLSPDTITEVERRLALL